MTSVHLTCLTPPSSWARAHGTGAHHCHAQGWKDDSYDVGDDPQGPETLFLAPSPPKKNFSYSPRWKELDKSE